jgi:hypothetical protein
MKNDGQTNRHGRHNLKRRRRSAGLRKNAENKIAKMRQVIKTGKYRAA